VSVAREFLRFAAVGVAATAAHYAVLIALKELGGVDPVPATAVGFAIGAVVSYVLNRAFTFTARPAIASSLAKFAAIAVVGAFINAGIVALLIGQGLYYLVAQVIATLVVLVWNYAGARLIVFR
jgi:putative flippase GtrA